MYRQTITGLRQLTRNRQVLLRAALALAALIAFAVYVAMATMTTLFIPPAIVIFIAPFALIAIAAAPQGRAVPKKMIVIVTLMAAALMPIWPTYIHLRLGPLPLLTPPRVLFYLLTVFWLYDMASSALRRGQFAYALKRGRWITVFAIAFFALNAISVPIAEGSKAAGTEFFRQCIIWLLPFCACLTYVRRWSGFKHILAAFAIGGAFLGMIAVTEFATGTMLAAKLSPFIMTDAEWLRIAQEVKSRDGIFRAQATHTHPISLGEYLSLCAPLALAFLFSGRGKARLFWIVVLLLILSGVMATNSRGAVFSLGISLGLTAGIFAYQLMRKMHLFRLRPVIGLGSLVLILCSPLVLVAAHHTITGGAGASAARSSQGRVDQIKLAWPKIIKRPVGGHGTGRSARIVGYYGRALSLDNYYLSLAVDMGFPGPLCFLGILAFAFRSSLRQAKTGPPEMQWALIGFAAALASFAVSRSIISQTGNMNFFFPLIGAYIGALAAATPLVRASRKKVDSGFARILRDHKQSSLRKAKTAS